MIGIGAGIIIATIVLSLSNTNVDNMTQQQIEQRARDYGMEYPQDFKVINEDVEK